MADTSEITNDILRSLPPEDLERLRPHLRRKKLAVGEILYEPGDDVDRVYFPESGLISLITPMIDGHEVETMSRGRDGGVGYVEACGSALMLSRVAIQIKGEAWCLAAAEYCAAYQASPLMREQMQRRTEILLADARQASACRAVHPASGRLGRTLLETYHHTGELRLPLTQEYLAGMIGVGRTTVTHAAGRLQDLKLIRYSRGVVHITQLEALQRHVCECYQVLRDARAKILGGPPSAPSWLAGAGGDRAGAKDRSGARAGL